jgi:hypothetical protein
MLELCDTIIQNCNVFKMFMRSPKCSLSECNHYSRYICSIHSATCYPRMIYIDVMHPTLEILTHYTQNYLFLSWSNFYHTHTHTHTHTHIRSRGSIVVKAMCYNLEGRGSTRWGHWLFSNLSNPSSLTRAFTECGCAMSVPSAQR